MPTFKEESELEWYIKEKMSKEKRLRLETTFDTLDVDQSGLLDVYEVHRGIDELGIDADFDEIKDMLRVVDQDGDGLLTKHEFMLLFDETRLKQVFESIDIDNNQYIDANEISKAFDELGWEIEEDEIDDMIGELKLNTEVSSDGKKIISIEEFISFFEHIPLVDIHKILKYWKTEYFIDSGSELTSSVPLDDTLKNFSEYISPFIAGGCGGVVSRTLTAPFERITILQQTSSIKKRTSALKLTHSLIKNEGFKSLYRGNAFSVARIFPFSGAVCLTYVMVLKHIKPKLEQYVGPKQDKWFDPLFRFGAGSLAGSVATILTYPMDMMRTHYSVQTTRTPIWSSFKEITKGNIFNIYRGLGSTLVAACLFIGAQQSCYDVIFRKTVEHYDPHPKKLWMYSIGSGISAGIMAQTIIHPIDLIRRRIQLDSTKSMGSSFSILRQIMKEESITGLYRGIRPATAKIAPAVAVALFTRDSVLGRI